MMRKLMLAAVAAFCVATAQADNVFVGGYGGAVLVSSTAYEASKVLLARPGKLYTVVGYNSGAAQFIQIHNAVSVPANGAVPTYTFTVPATSNFALDVPMLGADFTIGVVICNSSTGPTKTLGAADCWFTATVQ